MILFITFKVAGAAEARAGDKIHLAGGEVDSGHAADNGVAKNNRSTGANPVITTLANDDALPPGRTVAGGDTGNDRHVFCRHVVAGNLAKPHVLSTKVFQGVDLDFQGSVNTGEIPTRRGHLLDATALFLPEGSQVARLAEQMQGGGLKLDEGFAVQTTHGARGEYPQRDKN